MIYIYALCEPNTEIIRYVGQTNNMNKRLYQHIYEAKSIEAKSYKNNWIRKLLRNEEIPEMILLDEVEETESNYWEGYWIEQCKVWGFKLSNSILEGDRKTITSDYRKKLVLLGLEVQNRPEVKEKKSKSSKEYMLTESDEKKQARLECLKRGRETSRLKRLAGGYVSRIRRKRNSPFNIQIEATHIESGEVTTYYSIGECANKLGFPATKIREVTIYGSKRKNYKGYVFKDLTNKVELVIYKLQFNHKVYLAVGNKNTLKTDLSELFTYSRYKKNTLGKQLLEDSNYVLEILEEVTESNKEERLLYYAERYVFDGFQLLNDRINEYRRTNEWKVISQYTSEGSYVNSYSCIPRILESNKINKTTIVQHIYENKYQHVGGFKFIQN